MNLSIELSHPIQPTTKMSYNNLYKCQMTMVPMNQTPFCAPETPINTTIVQEVFPCAWCWRFCNPKFCRGPGPVHVNHPGMRQSQQNPSQDYHTGYPPSSGPSRPDRHNQRNELREAGFPYQFKVHDSAATFLGGSSVVPDHVRNDANETRGRKVRKTPTKNPIDD